MYLRITVTEKNKPLNQIYHRLGTKALALRALGALGHIDPFASVRGLPQDDLRAKTIWKTDRAQTLRAIAMTYNGFKYASNELLIKFAKFPPGLYDWSWQVVEDSAR